MLTLSPMCIHKTRAKYNTDNFKIHLDQKVVLISILVHHHQLFFVGLTHLHGTIDRSKRCKLFSDKRLHAKKLIVLERPTKTLNKTNNRLDHVFSLLTKYSLLNISTLNNLTNFLRT